MDRQADGQTEKQMDRQSDRQMDRWTDGQPDRQTDSLTDSQADRQTEQAGRHTDRQAYTHTHRWAGKQKMKVHFDRNLVGSVPILNPCTSLVLRLRFRIRPVAINLTKHIRQN
jgi:hypothetical protein